MERFFTWLDTVSFPVWYVIILLLTNVLSYWLGKIIEMRVSNRLLALVMEMTEELAQARTVPDGSPLAMAMIKFRRSLAGVSHAMAAQVPERCIHNDNPDECGICRH